MGSPAFAAALPFVLRWEGGLVDHPDDPGGRTNKGITQRVYDEWRTRQGLAHRDVALVEDVEVEAIYEAGYWVHPRCDLLRSRLDLVQFDTAVNTGPRRAVRFLQAAVGCGVDGIFGRQTAEAAEGCDLGAAIEAYCDARLDYYRRLAEARPELRVFLRGWTNRVDSLRAEAGLRDPFSRMPVDFGDAGYVARIPDVGVDPAYDLDER